MSIIFTNVTEDKIIDSVRSMKWHDRNLIKVREAAGMFEMASSEFQFECQAFSGLREVKRIRDNNLEDKFIGLLDMIDREHISKKGFDDVPAMSKEEYNIWSIVYDRAREENLIN